MKCSTKSRKLRDYVSHAAHNVPVDTPIEFSTDAWMGAPLDIPIEVPATAGKHAVMDITMSFPEDGQLADDPMDFPLEACLKSYWMPQHRF